MIVGVLSAAGVSYLQSPVFAIASIFGPSTVQAVMAGKAAVAVMVNLVQLVGAAISLYTSRRQSIQSRKTPEETSAFVSLAFATCFLCISLFAHSWLIQTPEYKILITPIKLRIVEAGQLEEHQALMSSTDPAINPNPETARERIVRVAKANIIYEIAVAYVFIVTLVCPFHLSLADLLYFVLIHNTIVYLPTDYSSHQAC
jgi:solute carrier family 29 (equilibrative nucleoside transporter), member 1/2/3